MEPKKPLHHHLYDYFLPHTRNAKRPHFFSAPSLVLLLVGLLALEGAYFTQTRFVFQETEFLASVLPGVLTNLTNSDRALNNLEPVTADPLLAQAAQLAAKDMADNGYFAHVSPSGKDPWYWLLQVGYSYTYAGQNLAVNFTDSQEVEEAWLNSPTHRANIMKAQYTRIGIGTARGKYEGRETIFVVSYFATPKTAPVAEKALTPAPVVAKDLEKVVVPILTEREPVASTSVLGVEQGTIIDVESVETEEVTTLLSPEDIITPSPGLFEKIATSPYHTLIFILTVLTLLILLIIAVAISVHTERKYIEAFGGGLSVFLLILGLLLLHVHYNQTVRVPESSTDTNISS
jgi:hypothetical protein